MPRATTKKTAEAPKFSLKDEGASVVKKESVVKAEVYSKPELTPNMLVPCMSLVRTGFLIYASKRTVGYQVIWHSFMETQFVELGELSAMKSSDYAFFENNWIVIPDSYELKQEVLKYLGVERCYEHALDVDGIQNLFDLSADEIIAKVFDMSDASKNAVRALAEKAITDGSLDSLQKIHALEYALNCKLM